MNDEQIKSALLAAGPMSSLELRLHLGIGWAATRNGIMRLRAKKLVRIASYQSQPDGIKGRRSPIYALGSAADAIEAPAKSAADINRDYRKRHSAVISARRYPHVRQAAGVWAGLMA